MLRLCRLGLLSLALWGAAACLKVVSRDCPRHYSEALHHDLKAPLRLAFLAARGHLGTRCSLHSGRICAQQPLAGWGVVGSKPCAWHCSRPRLRPPVHTMSSGEDTMPNLPQPVSPLWGDWTDIEVKAATVIWVNRMVIGLDLCPFALASMPGLRVVVSDAVTKEEALDFLALEMGYLVQQPKNKPATTLAVFPLALFGPEEDPSARSYPRGPEGSKAQELALNEGFLQSGGAFVDPSAAAAAERYRTQAFPSSFRQGSGGISSLSEKGDYSLVAQGLEPLGMDEGGEDEKEAEEQDGVDAGGDDAKASADEDMPFWGLYGDVDGGGDTMIVPAPEGPDSDTAPVTTEEAVPFWGLRGDADGGSDSEIVPSFQGVPEAETEGAEEADAGDGGEVAELDAAGGVGEPPEDGASAGETMWAADTSDGGE